MKGSIQFLTGEGVAEGCERTAAAVRNLVMEDPALADISFEDQMTKARKAFKDAGAIRITARMVTRRLRARWELHLGLVDGETHTLPSSRRRRRRCGMAQGVDPAECAG